MELQLSPYEGTHLLHALAIDAKITVTGARGGTEVDSLGFIVEQKFDIVNEAKQQAGGLVVEVGLVFLDELHAWQGTDDFLQRLLRLSARLTIAKWRDSMILIRGLRRDAIGTARAMCQGARVHVTPGNDSTDDEPVLLRNQILQIKTSLGELR